MLKRLSFTVLLTILIMGAGGSQEIWSLEKCIRYAQDKSLDVQQALLGVKQAELNERGNRMSRLPDLNAGTSGIFSFGRTIDFTTNTFTSDNRTANSMSLSSNVVLFNGGRIHNSIKQSSLDASASKADADDIARNTALNIAAAYLSVLLAEEQLTNTQKQLEQTQNQLSQTARLVDAGTRPESDRVDVLAQIALNEQAIVAQQNVVQQNYLNLKQLMQIDPDYNLVIEKPAVMLPSDDPDVLTLNDVYNQALNAQPSIRAGELRVRSAEIGVDIAKAGYLPSLSLSASLSSSYSNQARTVTFENPRIEEDIASVEINDVPAEITFFNPTTDRILSKTPYTEQIDNNFGQDIRLNLNIPIFNNDQNKIAVERAKLNILSTEIDNKRVKQQLKTDVQRALADARAAKKQYNAAQRSVEALSLAYSNAQKRYELGAINTFEYTTAQNQLDQAQVDLIVAKYDYVFRMKIIDFYLGNSMNIN
ncbi:MAG: TolC family protein [Bacteroidota bacterium]